ncbi:hypothetical protein RRG08_066789 [Elysia crispata]|uniref:Uncharacterized protein n=1 Tax=Elysia crispata TaxID=231223 RepID=A0AAE0XQN2_9GAST|nr:hypothetical protein RRG08_066789 [Elysia crispata]
MYTFCLGTACFDSDLSSRSENENRKSTLAKKQPPYARIFQEKQPKLFFQAKNLLLEGPALECLGKNEPPRRSSVAKITDSLKEAEDNNIDWFLILYGSEILAVIYILLWTISNFIQHLRLIMWGHRMLLEEQEGYLKRVNLMPANEKEGKDQNSYKGVSHDIILFFDISY